MATDENLRSCLSRWQLFRNSVFSQFYDITSTCHWSRDFFVFNAATKEGVQEHCPLCHHNITPGEESWKGHLMGQKKDACSGNPRRLPSINRCKSCSSFASANFFVSSFCFTDAVSEWATLHCYRCLFPPTLLKENNEFFCLIRLYQSHLKFVPRVFNFATYLGTLWTSNSVWSP